MDREDILKFTNSVILLSKLFTTIEDRFLKQKLHNKLSDFISAFIEQKKLHVAQSIHRDLLNSINNLLDFLEHLAYTSKNNTTPLLVAQRNLLKFKLHILQRSRVSKERPKAQATPVSSNLKPSKPKLTRMVLKADSNKERIFNYIKKTPHTRTKDILKEFSALSDRTVKRSLKELTEEGLLKKRTDGIAVHYLAAESN